MSERWRVLDCTNLQGKISSDRGAIVVSPEDRESARVPVADVAVILVGPTVQLSAASLHRMMKEDIPLLLCDWKGVPEGGAYSWREHGRVGARHIAQTALTVPRQKNAWAQIIRAKVMGQSTVLKEYGRPNSGELASFAKLIRSGDPSNIEGRAARLYWQSLWGSDGFRRTPSMPDRNNSTRNAQLDYAYTVLRGHGIRAVLAAGLTPALGVFHHGRSNNFSLVDDLIEPFRPAVDSGVAHLAGNADMKAPETRKRLVAAASRKFLENGLTIPAVLEDLAQQFGRYVEGDIPKLHVEYWRGAI